MLRRLVAAIGGRGAIEGGIGGGKGRRRGGGEGWKEEAEGDGGSKGREKGEGFRRRGGSLIFGH